MDNALVAGKCSRFSFAEKGKIVMKPDLSLSIDVVRS